MCVKFERAQRYLFMDNPSNIWVVVRADVFHRSFKNSMFQVSQAFVEWSLEGRSLCAMSCNDTGGRSGRLNVVASLAGSSKRWREQHDGWAASVRLLLSHL